MPDLHRIPLPPTEHFRLPDTFEKNASVIIIGNRGTGISSLSLILSMALQWRLIDTNNVLQDRHGLVTPDTQSTGEEYRKQQSELLRSLMEQNSTGCVIACGPACLDGDGPAILRSFASSHLVIHVTRDREWVQTYLGKDSNKEFLAFSHYVDNVIRLCSNCEYHNLSQDYRSAFQGDYPEEYQDQRRNEPPSLRLKQVAHDFLIFAYRSMGRAIPGQQSGLERLYPSPELRSYTYSAQIPLLLTNRARPNFKSLQLGADVIELVITIPEVHPAQRYAVTTHGLDVISENIAFFRRHGDVPIIYHVVLPHTSESHRNGDTWQLDTYQRLLRHGLRLACEYITVDMRLADEQIQILMKTNSKTKIIGHYADYEPRESSWRSAERFQIYERIKALGCDIARLVQSATSKRDNFDAEEFAHRVERMQEPCLPLIAYNIGVDGRRSCVFNKIFTPVAYQESTTPFVASPLTVEQAQRALFSSFELDPLEFSTIGSDVSYSVSPTMHLSAFQVCGMPHSFKIMSSASIHDLGPQINSYNYGGGTVAAPFKTDVFALVDLVSSSARFTGAINTLVGLRHLPSSDSIEKCGIMHEPSRAGRVRAIFGDNTDWIGMKSCLDRNLSPANAIKPDTASLIIGAGAMARAAVFTLMQLGVPKVFVLNRTLVRAQEMIQTFQEKATKSIASHAAVSDPLWKLPSLDVIREEDEWPTGVSKPTVIISCVPEYSKVHIPEDWTTSRTGGVFLQVSSLLTTQ